MKGRHPGQLVVKKYKTKLCVCCGNKYRPTASSQKYCLRCRRIKREKGGVAGGDVYDRDGEK